MIITLAPRPLQKFIVSKFTKSAKMNAFWKGHLVFCAILLLFFIDLHSTAETYEDEKRDLQMRGAYMASGNCESLYRTKKSIFILLST